MTFSWTMTKYVFTSFALSLAFCGVISHANAFEIRFPVACKLMEDCWITRHVDMDIHKGMVEDYMCGTKSTDGNKSTHISLNSMKALTDNVLVIAVADGRVTTAKDIGGFCGVQIVIEHEKGWKSNYCHLQRDKLGVHEGQDVQSGQVIGVIGMSGQTRWPHLSYAIMRNGMIFDPFSGRSTLEGCSPKAKPMWTYGINPPYDPAQVADLGFSVGIVKNNSIINGTATKAAAIDVNTPQLSLWGMFMNVQKGDEIRMEVIAPSGRILNEYEKIADHNQDYYPIYFSTKRKNLLWGEGIYIGKMTITRNVNGNKIKIGKQTRVLLKKVE